MKKRALLVDDESKSRITLHSFLSKYCPTVEVVGEADGVLRGLKSIAELKHDVVFLDIEMNDGTGFDLLQKVPKVDFEIVFVTAFNQYAIKAFRYSAIDYLLKPIDGEDLSKAISRVEEKKKNNIGSENIDFLKKQLKDTRRNVINVCKKNGIPVFEKNINVENTNFQRSTIDIKLSGTDSKMKYDLKWEEDEHNLNLIKSFLKFLKTMLIKMEKKI